MSAKCGNCEGANNIQSVKQGNNYNLVIGNDENQYFCHKLQYILRNGSYTKGTQRYLCRNALTPSILILEKVQNKGKKGNCYDWVIFETHNRSMDTAVMDALAAKHDRRWKCCTGCSCVKCTCGH